MPASQLKHLSYLTVSTSGRLDVERYPTDYTSLRNGLQIRQNPPACAPWPCPVT
jgi:hypothetical protein